MMRSCALACLLLASLMIPASAQQPSERPRGPILSVKGFSRIEVKPDYAQFVATVSTKGRTLADAASAHEERATRALALLQSLKGQGVEIEWSTFGVNQDRPLPVLPGAQQPAKPPEPQFTAQSRFFLKVKPIDSLNVVSSKIAASGLFEMQRGSFGVERDREALLRARRAAMLDARQQAEAYADAGDVRLMEIIEIVDSAASSIVQGQFDLPVMARAPQFVEVIPPATVTLSASVEVVWRIAPR